MIVRLPFAFVCCALAVSCGQPTRDNPLDPVTSSGDEGIQLIADLSAGGSSVSADRLAVVRYTVSAADMTDDITGTMNLVGDRATALVRDVGDGLARVFRVDALDANGIRTFSAADPVDVGNGVPQVVQVSLQRLTGSIEITTALPPPSWVVTIRRGLTLSLNGSERDTINPAQNRQSTIVKWS